MGTETPMPEATGSRPHRNALANLHGAFQVTNSETWGVYRLWCAPTRWPPFPVLLSLLPPVAASAAVAAAHAASLLPSSVH